MISGVEVVGADRIAIRLFSADQRLEPAVRGVIRTVTELTKTNIQANASGRPGPNAPTGDYRRSWTTTYRGNDFIIEGVVGTNKPQGRRLEYGFYGADSLGRVYNQPPYPHVGPAKDVGHAMLVQLAGGIPGSLGI